MSNNLKIKDPFLHAKIKDHFDSLCGIDFSLAIEEETDLTEEDIDCSVCLSELQTIRETHTLFKRIKSK